MKSLRYLKRRIMPICVLGVLGLGVFSLSAQPPAKPIYLDPSFPLDRRVDDLLSRMTLAEKASQLTQQARAIPRLGIPAYNWWTEGLHGVGYGGNPSPVTVFPEPIGLAASFDTELVNTVASAISNEFRANYNRALRNGNPGEQQGITDWGPNINIFRDPRWGRGQETYGEDPYLTSQLGVSYVTGMQGSDPRYLRVAATPKHFAVHSGPEPLRHSIDVSVSKHDLEDTYLPAFRAVVVEGRAAGVMCAYNSINGQPACANSFLLLDQLRNKWNFQGYVVSDCDSVADMVAGHHYVKTLPEAAAVSMKSGTDSDCKDLGNPHGSDYNKDYAIYLDAVKEGILNEGDIDQAVRRLFRIRFMLGMFDPDSLVPYSRIHDADLDSQAHRQLALRAARESMVLLKNDGVLPLKQAIKSIAVVGPLATQSEVMLGDYHGGASRVTTALEGITKQFPNSKVMFRTGTTFLEQPVPIPESELSTGTGESGLKAEFFAGKDFQGPVVLTRVDKEINFFNYNSQKPAGLDEFSVRWTGFFIPTRTGTAALGVRGSMNRLWLDDKLIVNDDTIHRPQSESAEVQVEKGHRYRIRLEGSLGNGFSTELFSSRSRQETLESAVAAAKAADVVVAVVGITSELEAEEDWLPFRIDGFRDGDRTSLNLPKQEEELLIALKTAGKPLIVVLTNGSALSVNWAKDNANAILEAWYPGEEGGTAIGETLAGANNPAGRLPVTFYKGIEQLSEFTDYSMKERTYRYFHGTPLYPFGFGLSYSTYSYRGLTPSANHIAAGDALELTANVTNTSTMDGDEIVQVYLSFPPLPGSPIRALRGFRRVHLGAGETTLVHFVLTPRDMSVVTEAGDRIVASGEYHIYLGGGQPGSVSSVVDADFNVTGSLRLPE